MKLLERIKEFCRENRRRITTIHSITKLIVFATLIYTSIVMYNLGNLWLSGIIALVVVLYLILTKLDNV